MKKYTVAVVGATGAVGEQIIRLLQQKPFEIENIRLLASKRSANRQLTVNGQTYTIEETTETSFNGVDIAFFSAGGSVSKQFAPIAIAAGAIVVDNTSAFRMDPDTPLVVPEVNADALKAHHGLIANPNCSTIQMVVALQPLREKFGLKRIIVSTYQAVSGAGLKAIEELKTQTQAVLNHEEPVATILPCGGDVKHYPIAFNALPQIDKFDTDGYTFEEWKMMNETKKIMSDDTIQVAATCVRVPVMSGHSESVYVELDKDDVSVADIWAALKDAPGVILEDDVSQQLYPTAQKSVGRNETFVGRVRRDLDNPKGFHLWVVSDNLLKGAAWNSVQIAQTMIAMDLL